jgi:hypothetical protein
MGRLRTLLQETPYGRPVKIRVLREGRELELSAVWDAPKK